LTYVNFYVMSFNTSIKKVILTRIGRIQENTIIINDIILFDIRKTNKGVLTV